MLWPTPILFYNPTKNMAMFQLHLLYWAALSLSFCLIFINIKAWGPQVTFALLLIMNLFKRYTHNITMTLYKIDLSRTQYIPLKFTTYQDVRWVRLVDGLETNILWVSPLTSNAERSITGCAARQSKASRNKFCIYYFLYSNDKII